MSSLFVTLDSREAKNEDPSATGSRFTVNFNRGGLQLKNPNPDRYVWGCALHSLKVYNTIPNISADNYSNAQLEFKRNNADAFTIINIPEGQYNPSALNAYIHSFLYSNGFYGGSATNPVFAISLDVNNATSQFVWNFRDPTATGESGATNYTVRMPANINKVLGFNANQELDINDSLATRSSPNAPDITYGVNEISVNLSCVESSYRNSQTGQTIEVYTPDVPPGGLIQKVPVSKVYLPVNQTSINNLQIYLLDNLGRDVDLRNEDTVLTIEFKLMKRYG